MKLVAVVAIALVGFAASSSPQEAELKKAFKDLEGLKKTTRKLSKDARERVEKAIEGKLSDADASAVIWEGRARVPEANPSEAVRILCMVTTAKGAKGDVKIGVVVAPEERVVAALLVLDNKDDAGLASSGFTEQFGRFLYGPQLLSPASELKSIREKVRGRADAEQKKVDGMFRMQEIMHPVGAAHHRIEADLDAGKLAPEDVEVLLRSFQEAAKVLPDLTFLKPSQVESFRKRLDESAKAYRGVGELAKAGKWAEARAAANDAEKESCSRCHAGTQRIFREQRTLAGIGNGFFAPGHDVEVPPGPPPESAAAVAAAVRRAVLILSEAK